MSSSTTNGGSDELSIVDKRMITKMLGDAAVPPQIINEVTANVPLSRQLLAIIDEAKKSGKPAGAETWKKVEAALAQHGIKRQRVDMSIGQGEPGPVCVNAEEEKAIREYLGGGGAPESLIREVLGKRELADGLLGVIAKAKGMQKK